MKPSEKREMAISVATSILSGIEHLKPVFEGRKHDVTAVFNAIDTEQRHSPVAKGWHIILRKRDEFSQILLYPETPETMLELDYPSQQEEHLRSWCDGCAAGLALRPMEPPPAKL